MKLRRREFVAGTLGAAVAGRFLAAPAIAQGGPIRIGCITSLGGVYSLFGEAHVRGMQLAAEMINEAGGINGRQVEIVVRDDQLKPEVGLAAARELAGSGVHVFAGVLSSGVALALSGVMEELDSVFVNAASHGNNLTHEDFSKHYFRVTDYSAMRVGAGSRLMAEKYPDALTWGVIVPDAEIGRSTLETLQFRLPQAYKELHNAEITIHEPIWTKFGATDFRNPVASLMSQGIDGLFVGVGGSDEVTFLQQAGQFGLTRNLKGIYNSGSELQVPEALKDRTPENYWTGCHWYYGAYPDDPIATDVVERFRAKGWGEYPDGFVGSAHTAVFAIREAMAKGAGESASELVPALEGLTFATVKGQMELRAEDHQALCDVNYALAEPAQSPAGWAVTDYAAVDGRVYAGPPTPGEPMKFE